MARKFTREELHKFVWAKPNAAKELGFSLVALHEICRNHNIPHPMLDWWVDKNAGKVAPIEPLPILGAKAATTITIAAGESRKEEATVAEARAKARLIAAIISLSFEPAASPFIAGTIRELRNKTPGEHGLMRCGGERHISCAVGRSSIERLGTILPQLLSAAEAQGFTLTSEQGGLRLRSEAGALKIMVTEEVRRVQHQLTPAEVVQLAKWQRENPPKETRDEWKVVFAPDRPRFPEWDYEATGRLAIELDEIGPRYSEGPTRRTFKDAKTQRLEDMAADIAVGMSVLIAAQVAAR